jgi:ferredoxin
MIITRQKQPAQIIASLKEYQKVFLVGCGECASTCKTGGEAELLKMKQLLEENGLCVVGTCMPSAPCIASQVKAELAKNIPALRQAQAILVLACGLGAQSVKDNDRLQLAVLPACDTLFSAVVDAKGDFLEKCSLCAECILGATGGTCPVTLCAKGILNGPCGGVNKGKCEVDPDRDCAWVLIYREMEKKNKLAGFREIQAPKDFKKLTRPKKLSLAK